MSALNINDLPPELIIKIVQFLDESSLKNAALTCKLWNNLIESTCPWSLVLRDIHYDNPQMMNSILTTNRKIGYIRIEGVNFLRLKTETYEIFRKHGVNVVELFLAIIYMDSIGALADLLNLIPNLMYANIYKIAVYDFNLDFVLPDLKKLKELEWFVRDQRLLKCFRKAKLTTMNISEDSETIHCDSLVEFLSSQDTLMSLTVTNSWTPVSILAEMVQFAPTPLRLTKLTIDVEGGSYSVFHPRFDHENLVKFFKSQTENLKQVEIEDGPGGSVYEPVFALTKLDTLGVSIDRMPHDKYFYTRLEKNHSVRTIELRESFGDDLGFLCNFFEIFPNTRSLILRNVPGDISSKILVMVQSLQKLESLSICAINDSSFGYMKFDNLKALHIRHLAGKIDWDYFTKVNYRLTELTIERIHKSMFTNDDVDQIVNNVDLKSIRLGDGFTADDRFFEIIRTKCIRT